MGFRRGWKWAPSRCKATCVVRIAAVVGLEQIAECALGLLPCKVPGEARATNMHIWGAGWTPCTRAPQCPLARKN
eukprot:12088941-Alexandrium_andersonii.AAC.1